MRFTPIAIVGRACVLPGALSPEQLWELVRDGVDATSSVDRDRWELDHDVAIAKLGEPTQQKTLCDRGGYVRGFDQVFDPVGFEGLSPRDVLRLDPLVQWALHCGREALQGVKGSRERSAVVMGNLSFPSETMTRHAEARWLKQAGVELDPGDIRNRFMSGLPAAILGRALGLSGQAFCLDSACASGLVALKHAADLLQAGGADLVLAGSVQRADDLFLHVGFTALNALSPTGQSRPFHKDADGLLPAEGCVLFALKRLDDARRDGDVIHAVLRGIGTSNDAKGTGLLAPNPAGQVRAMRAAYAMSGLCPADIGLVECHATGTPVGDAIEVQSLSEVYDGLTDVPMGSLKSNLGHLITVAGAAAVLKMTLCMEHGVRPRTLHAWPSTPALDDSPFRLLAENEDWNAPEGDVRRAAISAFGFGGNNAHAILEQEAGQTLDAGSIPSKEPIAIVSLAAHTAAGPSMEALEAVLRDGRSVVGPRGARIDSVEVALLGLGFPPSDLDHALGQQNVVLQAGREALASTSVSSEGTGVFIGMGCDPEIARYGARARLPGRLRACGITAPEGWTDAAKQSISGPLMSAGVLGTMPNILANRLNHVGDLGAGSGSMSAEELSGIVALQRAVHGLRSGELEAAVVGASDMCCEPVHTLAMRQVAPDAGPPGDAAVVLVLKRLSDAEKDGDTVYATICDEVGAHAAQRAHSDIVPLVGHTGAASGLLAVAAATIEAWRGRAPELSVRTSSFSGQSATVHLRAHGAPSSAAWPSPVFPGPGKAFAVHPPAVQLPTFESHEAQFMPRSPKLPAVSNAWVPPVEAPAEGVMVPPAGAAPVASHPVATLPVAAAPVPAPAMPQAVPGVVFGDARVAAQQELLHQMAAAHEQWMATQAAAQVQFMQCLSIPMPMPMPMPAMDAAMAQAPVHPMALPPAAVPPTAAGGVPFETVPVASAAAPTPSDAVSMDAQLAALETVQGQSVADIAAVTEVDLATTESASFPGPAFSRKDLEHLSSGKISELFGPLFRAQDQYAKQTRMPMPPLLLADRVLGVDAPQAVLGKGTMWTETDVPDADGWFMHNGRMPPGIMIESGQADLLLISWMGIDLLNKGERVYRLLGCDVTFKGSAPKPGETLRYAISIDGHANQGPIRLMFFHYDCSVDGEVRMEVRGGQAGFFTEQELTDSAGILWVPEEDQRSFELPAAPPRLPMSKTSLNEADMAALAKGDLVAAFGPAFEATQCHTRTPTIDDGDMRFIDRVTHLELDGGPWMRGYLRCELDIRPDSWFFSGHFKNDPCMPGTLMLEGALQAMSIYMMAQGMTVDRDGWRFEPVTDHSVPLRCRGQVIPSSKLMELEVFVDTVIDDKGELVLYADLLGSIDGLKAFHARRMGLRLVPDWPLTSLPAPADPDPSRKVAVVDGFRFDHASLINCALGQPSKAFGPMYERFDGPRTVPRLPGPPYHFMSRIVDVQGAIGAMEAGSSVVVEYDIPQDAWYFEENGAQVMPFCVLMEAALQPCGWLASYSGPTLRTDDDLAFRNLDGDGTIHGEIRPGDKRLTTTSTLDDIAKVGPMVIVRFTVQCKVEQRVVYDLKTVFGFFPKAALASQNGLPPSDEELALLKLPSDETHDLTERPAPYFDGSARLAELGPQVPAGRASVGLCMLDRISGYWPEAGEAGLGRARGEKDVHTSEWMFAAHFFQDPVQPGSLGVEALTQLLQWTMLRKGLHQGLKRPRFEAVATDADHSWTYRGQVLCTNDCVTTEVELVEIVQEKHAVLAIAKAWLWVDGKRIYHMPKLAMRLVDEDIDAVKDRTVQAGGAVLDAAALVRDDPDGLGDVRAYWDGYFNTKGWPTEDICYGLLNRYVRDIVFEDAEAMRKLQGKSVLFLANHETAVESWLFAILASGLLQRPTVALAKDEHRSTWLGKISELCFEWPGVNDPKLIEFFARDNVESLSGIIEGMAPGLAQNTRSVLVHVEGTRSTHCRRVPVKFMASIFVELAMKTRTAIVPVRFTGGLPTEGSDRLEFPVGHGRQDYWFGKPIFPEELEAYSYRDRKYQVISAINRLGPAWDAAEPIEGDPELASEIAAWADKSGVQAEHAALLSSLRRVEAPHPVSQAIVAAADGAELSFPEGQQGAWMRELAKRLLG